MTAINRLVNKPVPSASDLLAMWDSQAGRTRNITVQSMSDFTGNSINPLTDVRRDGNNLVFTKFDGSTVSVSIA